MDLKRAKLWEVVEASKASLPYYISRYLHCMFTDSFSNFVSSPFLGMWSIAFCMIVCMLVYLSPVFPQSFGRDVLAGIATHVKHLDVRSLAGYVYRRGLIGDAQYGRLTKPRSTAKDRTLELSRILMLVQWARDPPQDIKRLYLALCDSYEDDVGQESHYQFAQILRNKGIRCNCTYRHSEAFEN